MLGLWKAVKGNVRICVSGFSKERFLNLLAANDIYAWDIVYKRGCIILSVTVKGLKKMRPILKKTDCRFKILSKHGLPFYIFAHRKRGAFIFGFCLFLLILFTMSQFIWLIDINGNTDISDAEILRFCNTHGVYEGALKHSIDTDELKRSLKQGFPRIGFISIVKRGTRLLIELSENIENTAIDDDTAPRDIICKRDCVITKIVAQSGTPCVKPGDTVKKGDILIRGAFDIKDDSGSTAPLSPAHSTGTVRGKWHSKISAVLPYANNFKYYTGKTKTVYSFTVFNIGFNYNFLKSKTKFEHYDIIERKLQLGMGPDYPLPAVIKKTVYREYRVKGSVFSKQQAENAANKLLNKKILSVLPVSCCILDKKVYISHTKDAVNICAALLLEDDIGGSSINGTNENSDR